MNTFKVTHYFYTHCRSHTDRHIHAQRDNLELGMSKKFDVYNAKHLNVMNLSLGKVISLNGEV